MSFQETFSDAGQARVGRETTILQSLTMMNGPEVIVATRPETGPALGAVLDSPFLKTEDKIETLYLAALTRKPRPEELQRMLQYVAKGVPASSPGKGLSDLLRNVVQNARTGRRARIDDQAFSDVFWALLNSSEFLLNH